MQYRNNRGSSYRPKPPRGPVKLSFGLLPSAQPAEAPPPIPVRKPEEPVFTRQEIVGTLDLKRIPYHQSKPLSPEYLERIRKNLKKIYLAGITSSGRSVIDYVDGELHVMFPYEQNSVERMKGLDRNERAWDPDQKLWRVFIGSFDSVFETMGRGFKLTDSAYKAINEFVASNYYAHFEMGFLGKLTLREKWFEELENLSTQRVKFGSSFAQLQKMQADHFDNEVQRAVVRWRAALEKYSFGRKPYHHQRTGIEFLLANPAAALLDEMGCGKTFQIASALGVLFQETDIDRALIVVPMSLLKTWQEELKLSISIPFQVIGGTPAQRAKGLNSSAPIFLVHYEGLRLEEEKLREWMENGRCAMVFDESQRIKNLQAQTTQAALRLRPVAQRCIIATGTPIANRPLDLFSQYQVMDKGETFGKSFPAFKNTFCEMEVQKINVGRKTIRVEKFIGTRNPDELQASILRTSLRRLKNEVLDLPPVVFKDFIVELKAEQKHVYAQMRDHLKVEIGNMSEKEITANASNLVVKLLRLSQISSNPLLLSPEYKGSNAKLSELEDLLEDTFSDDTKKVILWSHYVDNVRHLQTLYAEKYGAVAHTGEMTVEERQASVKNFQDNPACRLFIATPQSAKEGLTLLPRDGKMVADTMVYLDLSFDSASYVQSQARFHRIGQQAVRCLVIHLIAESTVDEYIRNTVLEKLKTATQVLDAGLGEGTLAENVIESKVQLNKKELLEALL
ncbi:MAG: DEAD/DEAH box helicase [Betaproteobacteria bacterium]|nr:DEAD/DEAH box helicase [Betaproteobacteria bacterium]